jgi:hypothetical protein
VSSIRLIGFATVVAAVVGGAGFFALQPRGGAETPGSVNANGCFSDQTLDRYYGFSDWSDVTRTSEYRVDWSPKTMRCDPATRTADVAVQITYATPQRDVSQYDTGPTILTQELFYTRERLSLRFDCANRQMAVVERRFMSEGEVVSRVVDLRVNGSPKLEPYKPNGLGIAMDERVCNVVNRLAGAA